MSDDLRQIIAANIRRYLSERHLSQTDMANALGISTSTASEWYTGKKSPRMDKIQELCEWLGIPVSEIVTRVDAFIVNSPPSSYYTNPETREIAQDIYEDKELRLLFADAKDASPQQLKMIHNILKDLKRMEHGEDDQVQ